MLMFLLGALVGASGILVLFAAAVISEDGEHE